MKTSNQTERGRFSFRLAVPLILFTFLLQAARAGGLLPGGGSSFPTPLDSWSFIDHTNWTDDYGDEPISFTNITSSDLGDGDSLVVDTNVPAWLSFEIYQTNVDATNIVVNGPGSITFWYGPGWATTNGGPGDWAQLIDVGEWTSNSSYGYWGFSIDPSGSNIVFESQDGLGDTYDMLPVPSKTKFRSPGETPTRLWRIRRTDSHFGRR